MSLSYSRSRSSSSRESVSGGCRRANGDFGIPSRCVCGEFTIMKTSRTYENPGRRYYDCRKSNDGGVHTWKWWDECMIEELTIVRLEMQEQANGIQEQTERITRLMSVGGPSLEKMNLSDEIQKITELETKNEREIAKVKYGILVGIGFIATAWYLFTYKGNS